MNKPNPYLEKSSSFLAGAALTHLGQNLATNHALKSKRVAKYLANSFTQGYHGVVDTSVKAKATRGVASVVAPDIALAHKTAHEVGKELKETLSGATPRQRAAARMMVEGRFDKLHKYKMHEDPVVKTVHGVLSKHLPMPSNLSKSRVENVQKLWSDKSHPLLSNIAKHIGRGKTPVGSQFKPGSHTQKLPLLSSAATATVDLPLAVIDVGKALAGSTAVASNKYGKKAVDMAHKYFVKKPIESGAKASAPVEGFKHEAYKFLASPTSAHLKRTTAAVSQAAKS